MILYYKKRVLTTMSTRVSHNGKEFFANTGNNSLSLSGQKISKISDVQGLSKLTSLEELNLINNQITEIEGLESLINLKKLYLDSNQISKIEGLKKLVNLEVLSLSNNNINVIGGIKGLRNLKQLFINNNDIDQLDGLGELVGLQGLWVEKNRISEIKNLDNLVKLESLNLGHNPIKEIKGLEKLSKLNDLGLADTLISNDLINDLGGFHIDYSSKVANPKNFIIYCKNEYVKHNNKVFLFLENRLFLSGHEINDIMDLEFKERVSKIELLSLVDCKISEIKNLHYFQNLKTLWLSFNHFQEIPDLEGLTELEAISLNDNNLQDISGLKRIDKLTRLNLTNNPQISNFTPINELKSIKVLKLSKMKIDDISFLNNLINLEELDLSKNDIEEIALLILPNLRNLDLTNNKIKTMNNLCQFPKLEHLNLNENLINELDCVHKMIGHLSDFSISKNKLDQKVYQLLKLSKGPRFCMLYLFLKEKLNSKEFQNRREIIFEDIFGRSNILHNFDYHNVRDIVKYFRDEYEVRCGPNHKPISIVTPQLIGEEVEKKILRKMTPGGPGYPLDDLANKLNLGETKAIKRILNEIENSYPIETSFYFSNTELFRGAETVEMIREKSFEFKYFNQFSAKEIIGQPPEFSAPINYEFSFSHGNHPPLDYSATGLRWEPKYKFFYSQSFMNQEIPMIHKDGNTFVWNEKSQDPVVTKFKQESQSGKYDKPQRYKKWIVRDQLPRGGQAMVFRVTNDDDPKHYALKSFYIPPNNKKRLGRYEREVEALKVLKGNNNIIELIDEGGKIEYNQRDYYYYVMELADASLKKTFVKKLNITEKLKFFNQIIKAFVIIEDKKLVHRDIKPANILVKDNVIKIADFGIVKMNEKEEITHPNEMPGARYFICPETEQKLQNIDIRCDIYALGKILYYLLSNGDTLRREYYTQEHFDLSIRNKDKKFEVFNLFFEKSINENREERFNSIKELRDEFSACVKKFNT